jgi:hypothetical protein
MWRCERVLRFELVNLAITRALPPVYGRHASRSNQGIRSASGKDNEAIIVLLVGGANCNERRWNLNRHEEAASTRSPQEIAGHLGELSQFCDKRLRPASKFRWLRARPRNQLYRTPLRTTASALGGR